MVICDVNMPNMDGLTMVEKLKSAGAAICLAGIDSMDQLSQFKSLSDVSLVNLGSQMITAAQQGEDGLKTLANCVKELHEQRLKVAASGIDNSELLNLCVKVKLDLVKGNYIHKEPQPLTTDALSEAMGF